MADTSTNSWKLLYEAGRQALQARKLQEAEQSFSAALQLAEDFAGGDPRLAATLNALARIYSLQRRYLAAAALLNRLLEVTERTLGPAHVQVAGVLTNLAEMYTHLGAAREELELRERVLAIRVDDPNADVGSLQRLRERVTELQLALAAQESPDEVEEEEIDPFPVVRTAEYSASLAVIDEVSEPAVERPSAVVSEPVVKEREDAYQLSPAMHVDAASRYAGDSADESPAVVDQPEYGFRSAPDHRLSDMERDELEPPIGQRFGSRTRLFSIAAGMVLVAGILAARSYVGGSNDERTSAAGSVSLANASVPTQPVEITPPAPDAGETPDPQVVERLADHRAERETARANQGERTASSSEMPEPTPVITPRVPRIDLDRTLKGVDVAVRAIDQRTKAITDSASAIRLQAPTFKKVKVAEP